MKVKFEIGQEVRVKGDKEVGAVLGFSFSLGSGMLYQVSSKEVDVVNKMLIEGIKTIREDELEAVKKDE